MIQRAVEHDTLTVPISSTVELGSMAIQIQPQWLLFRVADSAATWGGGGEARNMKSVRPPLVAISHGPPLDPLLICHKIPKKIISWISQCLELKLLKTTTQLQKYRNTTISCSTNLS